MAAELLLESLGGTQVKLTSQRLQKTWWNQSNDKTIVAHLKTVNLDGAACEQTLDRALKDASVGVGIKADDQNHLEKEKDITQSYLGDFVFIQIEACTNVKI